MKHCDGKYETNENSIWIYMVILEDVKAPGQMSMQILASRHRRLTTPLVSRLLLIFTKTTMPILAFSPDRRKYKLVIKPYYPLPIHRQGVHVKNYDR